MGSSGGVLLKKFRQLALLLASAAWILCLPIASLMALMSPMTFDAPGSSEIFTNWVAFWVIVTFPFVIVLSLVTTWISYRKKSYGVSCFAVLVPLLNVTIFIFLLIWEHLAKVR